MASTSKKTSKKLSGLAVAMGLGVAVATGHGVAGADPLRPGNAIGGCLRTRARRPSDPPSGAHPKAAEQRFDSAQPSATKPTHFGRSDDPKPTTARETSEACRRVRTGRPVDEDSEPPAEPPTVPTSRRVPR